MLNSVAYLGKGLLGCPNVRAVMRVQYDCQPLQCNKLQQWFTLTALLLSRFVSLRSTQMKHTLGKVVGFSLIIPGSRARFDMMGGISCFRSFGIQCKWISVQWKAITHMAPMRGMLNQPTRRCSYACAHSDRRCICWPSWQWLVGHRGSGSGMHSH